MTDVGDRWLRSMSCGGMGNPPKMGRSPYVSGSLLMSVVGSTVWPAADLLPPMSKERDISEG